MDIIIHHEINNYKCFTFLYFNIYYHLEKLESLNGYITILKTKIIDMQTFHRWIKKNLTSSIVISKSKLE